MNLRVKEIRKTTKLSQDAFGTRLGITGAGISKIENGHRGLTDQMILLICKEFNINEKWLRSGKGEMFKPVRPYGIEQLAQSYQLDDLDATIIKEYLSLDANKRKIIKDYIVSVVNQCNLPSSNLLDNDGNISLIADDSIPDNTLSGMQYTNKSNITKK